MIARRLESLVTVALAAGILMVIVSVVVPAARPVAGGCVLVVALIGIGRIRRFPRYLAIVLFTAGIAGYVGAAAQGARFELADVLSLNQELIGMLAGLSLLPLVIAPRRTPPRVRGIPAVWQTAVTVHLLGAVINISAATIVGDHQARRGGLPMPDAMILSRAYSSGAFWSPFWAAAAAAASFAPGAQQWVLLVTGGTLALVATSSSIAMVIRSDRAALATYEGYDLTWPMLRIPLVLVVLVVAGHIGRPDIPVTVLVLLGTVGVLLSVLLVQQPRTTAARVREYASDGFRDCSAR